MCAGLYLALVLFYRLRGLPMATWDRAWVERPNSATVSPQAGVSPEIIAELPRFRFPVKEMILDRTCAICLNVYEDGDELLQLPCQHFFHRECVDKWLRLSARCPLCNHDMNPEHDIKHSETAAVANLPLPDLAFAADFEAESAGQRWWRRGRGEHPRPRPRPRQQRQERWQPRQPWQRPGEEGREMVIEMGELQGDHGHLDLDPPSSTAR